MGYEIAACIFAFLCGLALCILALSKFAPKVQKKVEDD